MSQIQVKLKTLPAKIVELLMVDAQGKYAEVSGVAKEIITIDLQEGLSYKATTEGAQGEFYVKQKLYFNDAGELVTTVDPKPADVKASSARSGTMAGNKIPY